MTGVTVLAPAKVNLCLHVTGQCADGYHELDSLVGFADFGDSLRVTLDRETTFTVEGPMSHGVPLDSSNLVLKALALFPNVSARIELTKILPAAAGIGGGTSDAAALVRAVSQLCGQEPVGELLTLGADMPACVLGRGLRMRGIGQDLNPVRFPELPVVLVNPGVAVPTGAVFQGLACKTNPALPALPPAEADLPVWTQFLAQQRNDLEPAAQAVCPEITTVLKALRACDQMQFARMSGSGATCFAVFPSLPAAKAAAQQLARPGWWVQAGTLS